MGCCTSNPGKEDGSGRNSGEYGQGGQPKLPQNIYIREPISQLRCLLIGTAESGIFFMLYVYGVLLLFELSCIFGVL